MTEPLLTINEQRRLAELDTYGVLDSEREASFDELVQLAADICEVPIAVINFVGDGRQFFKAEVGLGVRETPLETSFCLHAILEEDFLYIPDATLDARVANNPLVTAAGGLKFYAGAVLRSPGGFPLGTLCVLDTQPRELTALQQRTLKVIARQIMDQLNLRMAAAARAEQENRYRVLFDSMGEGFCIVEFIDGPHGPLSDYVHIEANAAYSVHSGLTEVVGKTVRELLGDDAEEWIRLLREVLETGTAIRFERELGIVGRYFSLSAFRLEPADKRQIAVLFQDISPRRLAELELLNLNRTLEDRVIEEQTRFVATEEVLRQSLKMEAVGQLTGGLAHDFNNLLAGISGSFEMIGTRLAQRRGSDVERYLQAGQSATRKAAALTHRLLAFARRQTLSPAPVVINTLLPDLVELVQRTVGPEIAVEAVAAAGLWNALVDTNQLENALLNLCINARDAMPDGGRLTIETGNTWLDARAAMALGFDEGQYVTVCVSDTGTGMDKAIIDKVFEPFFTTKPLGEGTGLGLSMVYGFVRQSNGHVRINSDVGQGTMVCLYLPRHLGELDAASDDSPNDAGTSLTSKKTVLVIDDEPIVRMLVVDTLTDMGIACAEAGDGAAGLAILEQSCDIDLLITDVGLPGGMNGRQVAERARELRPDLKVLFITGYAENAVLNPGHIRAGTRVLTKPFSVADLSSRIEGLLSEA